MITIPFYNLLILPDVTLYFQKEFYVEMAKKEPEQNEELAFVMLKEENRHQYHQGRKRQFLQYHV